MEKSMLTSIEAKECLKIYLIIMLFSFALYAAAEARTPLAPEPTKIELPTFKIANH